MDNHPLQLDTSRSLSGLCTSGSVNTDLTKTERGSELGGEGAGSHGMCLTLKDHDHIRLFIQEFTFRGLLPHIEKNIRQLNDQVQLTPSTYLGTVVM